MPISKAPFFARSEFIALPATTIVRTDVAVERFERKPQHVLQDVRDDCLIRVAKNDAPFLLEQKGRSMVVGKGKPYVIFTSEPIRSVHDHPTALHGVCVPRKILKERVAGFADRGAGFIAPSPAWRHLEDYLSLLVASNNHSDATLDVEIETHIVDLLALALGAQGDSAELAISRGLRAARLRDVVSAIQARFTDPALSTSDLAGSLGLSRRYVNDLLAETGQSFAERVLELRLQKTRAMLADPAHDRLKIGEIALNCGFSEVSYFNRRFRARFGCSPSQYRGGVS